MRKETLYEIIGDADESYILAAHMTPERKSLQPWVKWVAAAACLCIVVMAIIPIATAYMPNQATDIFREGNMIEITSMDELPANYPGTLLAGNISFEKAEFYYKADGNAENVDDWYSLLLSASDRNGYILMHCMFGDTTVDDWKVSMVFTEDATRTATINGVDVQIARLEPSLHYEYWYYAIFEYDDVVYDIRVQSNDANYVWDVLNLLLND